LSLPDLAKPCSAITAWIEATQGASADAGRDALSLVDSLSSTRKYADSVLKTCQDFEVSDKELREKDGSLEFHSQNLHKAIMDMLQRYCHALESRTILALAKKEFKEPTKAAQTLPAVLAPMIHVLQLPWEEELEKLSKTNELPLLISKLSLAEAASSAMSAKAFQDEVFSATREKCEKFVNDFVQKIGNTADECFKGLVEGFKDFNNKFEEVEGCVRDWALKDIEWVFLKETEEEVMKELVSLKAAKKNAIEFSSILDALVKHESSFDPMKKLSETAKSFHRELDEAMIKSCMLGSYIVMTHLVVNGSTSKEEVEKSEKYCSKIFGVAPATLPEKLSSRVKELVKGLPTAAASSSAKPAVKKEAKAERKKDKEKDKDNKGDKGDKDKKRKAEKEPKAEGSGKKSHKKQSK